MTLTKEQLIARARFLIKRHQGSLANHPDQDGVAMDLELARIALAGMEAEPRAFIFWPESDPSQGFIVDHHEDPAHKDGQVDAQGLHWVSAPLYTAPQPLTTSERAELENYQHLSDLYHAQEKRLFKLAQRIKGPAFDKYAHSPSQAIDVLEANIFGESDDASHVADMAAQLESARQHIAELEAAPPAPVGYGESPVPLMPDFPGRTLTQRECYRMGVEAGKALEDGKDSRNAVRREHADWSQSTFGSVGPVGPLKHLSKEALEAAAEPNDLSEWADMQFLLWDAQRRAGITDDQITQAMLEKLEVNKARNWPEPKDGEPRMRIKAAPQQESE